MPNFERGQDPKHSMNIGMSAILFNKTQDAYSFDLYYSKKEWLRIIKWLLKDGYTPMETEQIVRSKLMRYAASIPNKGNTLETLLAWSQKPNEHSPRYKDAFEDFIKTEIDPNRDLFLKQTGLNEDMVGAGAVPGMGTAMPAQQVATTGNQFYQTASKGSGDIFGTPSRKKRKKKAKIKIVKESLNEENVNPYDPMGMALLKKSGIKPPFKKKRSKGNQNSMKQNI